MNLEMAVKMKKFLYQNRELFFLPAVFVGLHLFLGLFLLLFCYSQEMGLLLSAIDKLIYNLFK